MTLVDLLQEEEIPPSLRRLAGSKGDEMKSATQLSQQHSSEDQDQEMSIDGLFKKTKTKPHIYYKPLQ